MCILRQVLDKAQLYELASHIEELKQSGGGQGWTPRACVQLLAGAADSASAAFLLPSATGTALSFTSLLARHPPPPGTAVFGIRDPSLCGMPEARTLPFGEWAELLAAAVISARPHGPYVLAAHSGGAVPGCWACAEALVQKGESIARIVILDGTRPRWRLGADAEAYDRATQKWLSSGAAPPSLSRRASGSALGSSPPPRISQGSPTRWLSKSRDSITSFFSSWSSGISSSLLTELHTSPAKLSKRLSAGEAQRRESVTASFEHFCGRLESVWSFAVELSLERQLPTLAESRQLLEAHSGAEDALDYVCRHAAKADAATDVSAWRAVARCASDALVRPLPYAPSAGLDTTLVLITAERGEEGSSWPTLADLVYEGLATRVTETVVSLSASEGGEAARVSDLLAEGVKAGGEQQAALLRGATLRCMHDAGFQQAASAAIFGSSGDPRASA